MKMIKLLLAMLPIIVCLSGCRNDKQEESSMDDDKMEIIEINNANDFNKINPSLNVKYLLTNNIDFQGESINPIGDIDNPFIGIFDGDNHTISNYSINSKYNALFGYVNGEVLNLRINNSQTLSFNELAYIGQVVAILNKGHVSFCFSEGNLEVNNEVPLDQTFLSGIVAKNECGLVEYCQSNTSLNLSSVGTGFVGGIVAYNGEGSSQEAKVVNCIGRGNQISGQVTYERGSAYVGGVVGYNFGLVDKCLSYEQTITSKTTDYYAFAGGVVGDNNGGFISNCFSSSDVKTISNTSSTFLGSVMGRNFMSTLDENSGQYENCFGSLDQSLSSSIPLSAREGTTHERVAVDLASESDLSSPSWYKETFQLDDKFLIKDNYYPSFNSDFKRVNFRRISGSPSNPISINSESEFNNIDVNKSYILQKDLNFTGISHTIIGSFDNYYNGVFDGNNHLIKGINITSYRNTNSVFGYVNGIIKNLRTEVNVSFTASTNILQYASGLIAFSSKSLIKNCSSTTNININCRGAILGGLIGYNQDSEVINSYATSNISSTSSTRSNYVGGLVGVSLKSNYLRCFANCELHVSDSSYSVVGGLIGKNEGNVSSCYSLATIENSNIDTNINAGGLIGYSKSGLIKNVYTKANITTSASTSNAQSGGLCGVNEAKLVNGLYCVNEQIRYSCGHSPIEVDVRRMSLEELMMAADILGDDFYNVDNETPQLIFMKGGN